MKKKAILGKATLSQGNQVMNLILQKGLSRFDIQYLLESGILTDVLGISVNELMGSGPYAEKIRLAEIALAVRAVPKLTIFPTYHTVKTDLKIRQREFDEVCAEHEVVYEKPSGTWSFIDNNVGSERPPSVDWRFMMFPDVPYPSGGCRFSPPIIIRAMGFIPADVYDLMNYIETFKYSSKYLGLVESLVAAGSKLHFRSAVENVEGYTAGHPGLKLLENGKTEFRHQLISYTNYWPSGYYFLVRPAF